MKAIKVKKLHEDAVIPTKAHLTDAGFDISALEDVIIEPGQTMKIRTGLAFDLPSGYEMQIRPRSGISTRTKLRVILGTVDAGYNGEVGVILDNTNPRHDVSLDFLLTLDDEGYSRTPKSYLANTFIIRKGDRIAQAVIQKLPHVTLYEVESLSDSERGENGFGSSGV